MIENRAKSKHKEYKHNLESAILKMSGFIISSGVSEKSLAVGIVISFGITAKEGDKIVNKISTIVHLFKGLEKIL